MWGQPRPLPSFGLPEGDFVGRIDAVPTLPPMAAAVKAKPKLGTRDIVGILADAVATASGGQAIYAPMMMQKRRESLLERQRQEERDYERNKPIREKIGDDLVEINPRDGSTRTLYKGTPQPKTGAFAQRVADMRSLGATDEQIARLIENETLGTPVAVDEVDASGRTVRKYVRPGVPGAGTAPPAVLKQLPPGAVPLGAGGAGSGPRGFR